jgi:hypothetical protein
LDTHTGRTCAAGFGGSFEVLREMETSNSAEASLFSQYGNRYLEFDFVQFETIRSMLRHMGRMPSIAEQRKVSTTNLLKGICFSIADSKLMLV